MLRSIHLGPVKPALLLSLSIGWWLALFYGNAHITRAVSNTIYVGHKESLPPPALQCGLAYSCY